MSTAFLLLTTMLAAMLAGHVLLAPRRMQLAGLVFVLGFAVQTGMLLLTWLGRDILPGGVRAVTAAVLPGMLYLFFVHQDERSWQRRDAVHLVPALLMAGLQLWPGAGWLIDALLLCLEIGYALALLAAGPAASLARTLRWRRLAAAFLFSMAIMDLWIGLELWHGQALTTAASGQALAVLLLIATASLFVQTWRDPEWWRHLPSLPPAEAGEAVPAATLAEQEICRRLEQLFIEQRIHTAFGVGLDSIAGQLGLPPRTLSAAINRVHRRALRTLVNDHRVADAARQLSDPALTAKPITDIMFDAGFQTKSNFNKEFLVRMNATPSEFRRSASGASERSGPV